MQLICVVMVMMVVVQWLMHYSSRGHGSDHRLLVTMLLFVLIVQTKMGLHAMPGSACDMQPHYLLF